MLFLPLDSRPVSVALPRRLADCAGAKLKMPPVSTLGGLDAPADTAALMKWLRSGAARGEGALILSVDSLLFGGLVFSREPRVTARRALDALDELAAVREKSPEMKVYAFQSILRDAITVRRGEDLEAWRGMMEGGGHPEWFLELRKRNLDVSLKLVEMAGAGVLDCLALAKEDTSPDSPFSNELELLRNKIAHADAGARATVTTGTDEVALLLMAKWLCAERRAAPRFSFGSATADWKQRIPPYENQPLAKTIAEQVKLIGGEVANTPGGGAIEVIAHFYDDTPDVFLNQLAGRRRPPADSEAVERTVALARERLETGAMVALLDCAFANGGDPLLVRRLLREKLFFSLLSYAAWNTHANRAGCLIAHAAVTASRGCVDTPQRRLRRHALYMIERAVHDCVYSSVVRGRLVKFTDPAGKVMFPAEARSELREQLLKETHRLFKGALDGPADGPLGWGMVSLQGIPVTAARFPWGRLFEIDCRCAPDVAIVRLEG